VLSLAATAGRAQGVGLLLAYGLGRAVPLLVIGVSSDMATGLLSRPEARRWGEAGRTALGALILALAGYFLYLGI
jgi:cytochrome c biogenesis protein CcdA